MLPQHIALVSLTDAVSAADVMRVAGALQKQVIRDLAPLWGVTGTVSAYASRDDVPTDYWPIFVTDDVPGAAGFHRSDEDGKPFAVVEAGPTWSLTASHECLEMMVDPSGSRLVAGQSIVKPTERVEYLVEICDPCDNESFAYTINDVVVSDFYSPRYFDPVAAPGVRYSSNGAITGPRQLVEKGYICWREPTTSDWTRASLQNGKLTLENMGRLVTTNGSFRTQVDARTPELRRLSKANPRGAALRKLTKKSKNVRVAMCGQGDTWRREIERVTQQRLKDS